MGSSRKRYKRDEDDIKSREESESAPLGDMFPDDASFDMESELDWDQFGQVEVGESGGESEEEEGDESDMEEEEGGDGENIGSKKDTEMEELEKEYQNLRKDELNLLKNLRRHKDEDAIKGQAIKNQKVLWDRNLEFRFLLQKTFSLSNKLPQEPIKSSFCNLDTAVDQAFSDLISSCKQTLNCMLELGEALLENNPSIIEENVKESCKDEELSTDVKVEDDEDWMRISKFYSRIKPFRNNSVDKYYRKTQVITGAAAYRNKLVAFDQNISNQVNAYMGDLKGRIKGMQLRRSTVGIFGEAPTENGNGKEDANLDGDPELFDDSDFYQQLLKEFFETCELTSSEPAFYSLKRMQPRKRKVVDRRASKSRKIRYNVHEKIVNFMAPVAIPPSIVFPSFKNLFVYLVSAMVLFKTC
ncbi:hypothetical protein HPP92_023836 [Vanilla planifolia]|uniref:Protein AATF n=1 Tax=Vanilla planifolia TaxID=51239 RepID=A0A835PRM0_VANPL|nr:hypothetical protein HPP92_023836 [Vanilla planifolia]